MNKTINEIDRVRNNWNMTSTERGDKLFEMAKQSNSISDQFQLVSNAIGEYEKARGEGDTKCLCNLAHCYFVMAHWSPEMSNEYYRKSIELHIMGSKNAKYKYVDFYKFYETKEDNIDSILKTIRLVDPQKFNDPTDCPIAQEGLSTFLFPEKKVFDGLRVCCFGRAIGKYRAWEDSKKWAYYGNESKGICIRYRFYDNVLEDMLTDKFIFGEINYKEKFEFDKGIVADGFLSKNISYKEENEWRIVLYDRNLSDNQFYCNNNIYLPIGRQYLYQVFIGYRCEDSIVKTILDYANNGDYKIPVLKIHPDAENVFKLISTKIN